MQKFMRFLKGAISYVFTAAIAVIIYLYFRKKQQEGFSKEDLEEINETQPKKLIADIEEFANGVKSSNPRPLRTGGNWL